MTLPGAPPRRIDLPPGWVAEVVTYLEMRAPAPLRRARDVAGLALTAVRPTPESYRALFRRIGAPWLWASRLRFDDAALAAILADPAVAIHVLARDGAAIGLLELDFRTPPDCELAFFGVVPEAVGSGAGRYLMNRAIELAWARRPAIYRFFVHTCTHDHPAALDFYRRSGFVAYARAVECYPDPRLEGLLAATDAPQVPLIAP